MLCATVLALMLQIAAPADTPKTTPALPIATPTRFCERIDVAVMSTAGRRCSVLLRLAFGIQ
jgi:hypothetical protein